MATRVRNPGSGKAPVNTPASGIPAKGAGKGDGWGGEPKGAGSGAQRKLFTSEDNPAKKPGWKERLSRGKRLAKEEVKRQKQMRDMIGNLALNAEREETQLSAAVAYLNRSEGMPIAMQKN